MQKSSDTVIKEIDCAFSEVRPPRPDQIAKDPDSLDGKETISRFQGRVKNDLHDLVKVGIYSSEDLYYLTPESIQYYLPVYLRYAVSDRHHWEFSIISGLIEFLDRNLCTTAGIVYLILTNEQRASVCSALRFVADNLGLYQVGPLNDEIKLKLAVAISQWCNEPRATNEPRG